MGRRRARGGKNKQKEEVPPSKAAPKAAEEPEPEPEPAEASDDEPPREEEALDEPPRGEEGGGISSSSSSSEDETGSESSSEEEWGGEDRAAADGDDDAQAAGDDGGGDSGGEEEEDPPSGDEDEASSSSEGEDEHQEEEEEGGDGADGGADGLSRSLPPGAEEGEESCSFDLRNLTALNPHQVDAKALYSGPGGGGSSGGPATIDVGAALPNEGHLLSAAGEGCGRLLRRLWTLDTERTDVGMLAKLPGREEVKIPRALPPPPPKAETKWEKFAKERGISPKEKRSRKVWDEATQSWMYRHGYQRANSSGRDGEWPIMEVKDGDDPFADPWERARDEKKARVEKNAENRMRNQERAGLLPKGTATRTTKDRRKAREAGRAGGAEGSAVPGGVPVDLGGDRRRGKDLTRAALLATQTSTASLGKFDGMREGEPERRRAAMGLKRRKYESGTDAASAGTEAGRNARVLKGVLGGGGGGGSGGGGGLHGKDKERAIRRGDYAKGETAYDHEYDDGLGPSSFRKRKGRAGAGKMKKMTKKRAK